MSNIKNISKIGAIFVVVLLTASIFGTLADLPLTGNAGGSLGNGGVIARTVTNHGDLNIPSGETMWINDTYFRQDGNVTVAGTLILQNTTFEMLQDYFHRYTYNINSGWLQLFNSKLTVSTLMVDPYTKLNMTVRDEGVIDLTNSTFAFPGICYFSNISELHMSNSRLTNIDPPFTNPQWFDDNDDCPSLFFDSSSALFQDSRVDFYYENSWALDKSEMTPYVNPPPDNTGEDIANITSLGGGVYIIENGERMYMSGFHEDTDLIEDPISGAMLKVIYHTELGYNNSDKVMWTTGHGWKQAFVLNNHTSDYTDTYNVYLNGGNSLAELHNLRVSLLNNDTRNVSFDKLWVDLLPLYHYNITATGNSELIAINSFFDVDWGNPAPEKRNAFILQDNSRAYFYNMTVNETEISGDKFDSVIVSESTNAHAYIYRLVNFTVTDSTGMPLSGARINSSYSGGEPLATLVKKLNIPKYEILAYLGKDIATYNITDSSGRAIIPLVSDNVTLISYPNSMFYGDYNVEVYYRNITVGSGKIVLPLGLPGYPMITPQDNNVNMPVSLSSVETPRPDFYPLPVFPATVTNGSSIQLNATIFNVGNKNATKVLVQFYDGVISPATQVGTDYIIGTLNMGMSAQANTMWTASGVSHIIIVYVDPLNAIIEKNEANNTASAEIKVAQPPDLAISYPDVTFFPNSPIVNGTGTRINVTVHNLGDVNVIGAWVGFYYYKGSSLVEINNKSVDVPGGSSTMAYSDWVPVIANDYTVKVWVDPAGLVPDIDRSNNEVLRIFTVLEKPDFVPELILFNPDTPVDNNTDVVVTVRIANIGGVSADNVNVQFFDDINGNGTIDVGEQIGSNMTLSGLAAGDRNSTSVTWSAVIKTNSLKVTHTIGVVVNPEKSVIEHSYTNNILTKQIEILDRRADLILTNMKFYSAGWNEINQTYLTDRIYINVTLQNTNPYCNSTMTNVTFWYYDGTEVIGTQAVTFNGSEQIIANISWMAGDAETDIGVHTLRIEINPNATIVERNYKNNALTRSFEILEPNIILFWNLSISTFTVGEMVPIDGTVYYNTTGKVIGVSNRNVTVSIQGYLSMQLLLQNGQFMGSYPTPNKAGSYDITVSVARTVITGHNSIRVNDKASSGLPWMWIIIAIIIIVAALLAAVIYIVKTAKERMVECGECGALIPEQSKKCPKCGTMFESTMARCSNCKSWIPATAKECPECGVVFVRRDKKTEDTYEDKMKREYMVFVERYKEVAKRKLGKKYSEEEFWKWWKEQPTYIPFKDWLAKEEERIKKSTVVCPSCSTINPIGSVNCQKCGTILQLREPMGQQPLQDQLSQPIEQKPETPAPMAQRCIKCSEVLEGDTKFCTKCGAFQGAVPEKPVAAKPAPAKVVYKKVIKPGKPAESQYLEEQAQVQQEQQPPPV